MAPLGSRSLSRQDSSSWTRPARGQKHRSTEAQGLGPLEPTQSNPHRVQPPGLVPAVPQPLSPTLIDTAEGRSAEIFI